MNFDVYRSEKTHTINRVDWNYMPSMSDGREIFSEEFKTAEVGILGVVSITEHRAHGEGDKWFYDILHQDGNVVRIFNPHIVYFRPNEA